MEVDGRWAGGKDLGPWDLRPWRSRERAQRMGLQGEGQGVEQGEERREDSLLLTHRQWLPDLQGTYLRCTGL